MFSLICVWINGWVNNREAGDLIYHRAHYDVTVMSYRWILFITSIIPSLALWKSRNCSSVGEQPKRLWINISHVSITIHISKTRHSKAVCIYVINCRNIFHHIISNEHRFLNQLQKKCHSIYTYTHIKILLQIESRLKNNRQSMFGWQFYMNSFSKTRHDPYYYKPCYCNNSASYIFIPLSPPGNKIKVEPCCMTDEAVWRDQCIENTSRSAGACDTLSMHKQVFYAWTI